MRFLGILVILIGMAFLLMVPPLGALMVVVGLFMIVAGFGSSNANKTARAIARQMQSGPASGAPLNTVNAERWDALARYDDDVRQAVDQVSPLGARAVERLRNTYLALDDKTKLPRIVADIRAEFGPRSR